MILPDKYTTPSESLIFISAIMLKILSNKKMKIEVLYSGFKNDPHIKNRKNCFNLFLYSLVFMRTCGFISLNNVNFSNLYN